MINKQASEWLESSLIMKPRATLIMQQFHRVIHSIKCAISIIGSSCDERRFRHDLPNGRWSENLTWPSSQTLGGDQA